MAGNDRGGTKRMSGIKQGFTSETLVDDMSALLYIIRTQIESRVNTIDIVRVVGVNETGTIDVIPIIKNVNPDKEPIDEVPLYGIRYIKWQFGENAIIAKPVVGDIGLLLICKKDTSMVEAGVVGTNSKYNTSDGIYLGGLNGLNITPTQFVEFNENGITITSTGTITLNAENATVNATTINLGGENGVGVAMIGSKVTNNGQPNGTTVGYIADGSVVTKTL